MGLFDRFKKKDKPAAPAPVSVKIEARTVEVEVAQQTPGELPMADVGGYVSPSGGFVNFGRFRVSGMNASTGRKNTKRYEVRTEEEARAAATADGLGDPMTVEVEQNEGPTEQQVAYALDLKAAIPAGACKADVSAIISRITDEDEAAPDPGLSRWAHDCGVRFSRFVGHDALLGYSFPNFLLPEVILNFKKRHPDIQVSCQLCPTPEQYISQDIEQPALTLFVCGAKNPVENYSKLQGNPPMILFHRAYRCLTNSQSSLAGRNCVTPEDLKHRFCVLRSSAEARTPVISALLDWLSPVVPPEQFIRSESVESIIKMAETHDDVYALSYYPILNRYEGIHTGKLISIPFADDCGDGELCLFYSKRACQRHPELRELVDEIYKSSQSFIEETGD